MAMKQTLPINQPHPYYEDALYIQGYSNWPVIFINPTEYYLNDECWLFSYQLCTQFMVLGECLADALETLGQYLRDIYPGLVEPPENIIELREMDGDEAVDEQYLHINGGEFFLALPHCQEVSEPEWEYSITFSEFGEEDREMGTIANSGYMEQNEYATVADLIRVAGKYNLTHYEDAGWIYNEQPPEDRNHFENGADVYYNMHIEGQQVAGSGDRSLLQLIVREVEPK